MPIDLTKSEIEVLVDRINQVNLTNIDYRSITVGNPTMVNGELTSIVITGKPNSGITGSATLRYNRKNIATLIGSRNKVFTQDSAITTRDLVNKINTEYGIKLDADDIVDVALPVFSNGTPGETLNFTLTIAPTSLLYIGAVTLTLRRRDIVMSDLITNTTLGDMS